MVSFRSASVALRTLREAPVAKSTEMTGHHRREPPCGVAQLEAVRDGSSEGRVEPLELRVEVCEQRLGRVRFGLGSERAACQGVRGRACAAAKSRVGAGERDADDGLPSVDGGAGSEAVGPGEYAGALHEEEDVALARGPAARRSRRSSESRKTRFPKRPGCSRVVSSATGLQQPCRRLPLKTWSCHRGAPLERLAQLRFQAAGPKAWAPKQLRGLLAPFAGIEPPCSPRP